MNYKCLVLAILGALGIMAGVVLFFYLILTYKIVGIIFTILTIAGFFALIVGALYSACVEHRNRRGK